MGVQTWKRLGDTQEMLTFNVPQMFLCLCTHAACVEDAELVSWMQKCFASCPFAHPSNIACNMDTKCFCRNVISIVLTFGQKQIDFGPIGWVEFKNSQLKDNAI